MHNRILALIIAMLLPFGAVACDDTADGVETDTEQLGDDAEEGLDDLDDEIDEELDGGE